MTQRTDNGNWSMPSGAHDPGESLSMTVVRETLEETGITVRPIDVAGIFTDPRHVLHYTSDDEVRQESASSTVPTTFPGSPQAAQ